MKPFKPQTDYFKKLAVKEQNRTDATYVHWKNLVLARYGYRCMICHTLEKVEVHHIESFTRDETLRVNLDNGACLCKKHHKEYHNIYSNTEDINRDTFNKFLKEKGLDGI